MASWRDTGFGAVLMFLWAILMVVLGFWTGALYTFIALQTSGGDWKRFWYWKRA